MKRFFLRAQRGEITEYTVYKKLASMLTHKENKKVLSQIAKEELVHYNFWKKLTKRDVKPSIFVVWFYVFCARTLGLIFTLSLMERREASFQKRYKRFSKKVPGIAKIIRDEKRHERRLVKGIHEEKLYYISSIVLGLNDALVEITGTLAGLTFALQQGQLIGIVGLITGIAASLSMASSEYLSMRHEKDARNPLLASLYTGVAYFFVVLLLILPYFLANNIYVSLAWAVFDALVVILVFNYYISVAKGLSFKERFFEMATISVTVALVSFVIGYFVRMVFGIDI